MRPGFIGMTQKPNSDYCSGRAYCLHAQKGKASLLKCSHAFFFLQLCSCVFCICFRRTYCKHALLHSRL